VQFPASEPGVIAVAATNLDEKESYISVSGPEIVISAPGERVLRAGPGSTYVLGTGTSDSAAIVSGVVALILEAHPGISPKEVLRRISLTADDKGAVGRDEKYGFGIVNPLRAVTAVVPEPSSASPASSAGAAPNSGRGGRGFLLLLGGAGVLILLAGAAFVGIRRSLG
jgi:subtilisin family serine protease